MFRLPSVRLMLTSGKMASPLSGECFPLTRTGKVILKQLLGLPVGNFVNCIVPDNLSRQNLSDILIIQPFANALNIATATGMDFLLCILEVEEKKNLLCYGI